MTEKKWVFGTKDKKWHLVGPEDRDYDTGISQKEFKKIGKEKAKKKYLSPSLVGESKLRTWLEEETVTTPEQRNWKSIEPKMDLAISSLVQIIGMVTKRSDVDVHLRKLVGSLKAMKADLRLQGKR